MLLVGPSSPNVKLLLVLGLEENKRKAGWVKLVHPHGCSVLSLHLEGGGHLIPTSLTILVVHRFHAPIRQELRQKQAGRKKQTKLDEICPVCIKYPAKVG